MKVILDCNIWISFLLSKQDCLLKRMLMDTRFDIYICEELLSEIINVARRDKIRKRVSENELQQLLKIIDAFCEKTTISQIAESIIRDPKDLYLLSLAETIDANYIVSGDKDLTDLNQHLKTRIVKLADFKLMMGF
ncbi:putative toxin-antitoxin system toxin component, PIN family [bacterium]|nr:putative toxin-antitoxin system toxin component, PIN family [bacterium]